ncbi:MAG TPA: COX15/CtaA family protein [Gammaproteobacteria bacterium]|nr:COX15/CtaA family protein [Gammaproteobacteria bacterium]
MAKQAAPPLPPAERWAYGTTLLAFVVIVLGAYTRLTDAGLGCPDWPGCYGQLVPQANAANSLINTSKAWTEMIHRYLAGSLGIIIFALAFFIIKNKSSFKKQSQILALATSGLVVFQALLGMWTVTLKLFPAIVMAHLMGGLATLSLLWWLTLTLRSHNTALYKNNFPFFRSPNSLRSNIGSLKSKSYFRTKPHALRIWGITGLIMLVIQIFLGGWTSANYAALVCLDFPFCNNIHQDLGLNFQLANIFEAFNFTSVGVDGSQGTPLRHAARILIHMMHRIGALLTILILGWLALLAWMRSQNKHIRMISIVMASLLMIQILLGITNILAKLPLAIAVAHNAVAALLLLSVVTLNYFMYTLNNRILGAAQHESARGVYT